MSADAKATICPFCKGRGGFDSAEDSHECSLCAGSGALSPDVILKELRRLSERNYTLESDLADAKREYQVERQSHLDLKVKLIDLLHAYGTGETEFKDGENITEMVTRIVAERDAATAEIDRLKADKERLQSKLNDTEETLEDVGESTEGLLDHTLDVRGALKKAIEYLDLAHQSLRNRGADCDWDLINKTMAELRATLPNARTTQEG